MPTPSTAPQQYRINIMDERGTISFLAPAHAPKMLTAVVGLQVRSSREALEAVSGLDDEWANAVRSQLVLFDEFNVGTLQPEWRQRVLVEDYSGHPAFTVIDDETRARSLQPGSLGLIVFNLKDQRIIQVQNTGSDLEREGSGRYRERGEPSNRTYTYSLPESWSLVP